MQWRMQRFARGTSEPCLAPQQSERNQQASSSNPASTSLLTAPAAHSPAQIEYLQLRQGAQLAHTRRRHALALAHIQLAQLAAVLRHDAYHGVGGALAPACKGAKGHASLELLLVPCKS